MIETPETAPYTLFQFHHATLSGESYRSSGKRNHKLRTDRNIDKDPVKLC